jgi:hypothetical protein
MRRRTERFDNLSHVRRVGRIEMEVLHWVRQRDCLARTSSAGDAGSYGGARIGGRHRVKI